VPCTSGHGALTHGLLNKEILKKNNWFGRELGMGELRGNSGETAQRGIITEGNLRRRIFARGIFGGESSGGNFR
jgi:hypothetical protein